MQRPLAAIAALLLCALACTETRPMVRIGTRHGEVAEVLVEVVDTPEARNRGLMYRKELPEGHGMLFLFENEANHTFWMKNTEIPLDLLFLGPGGHVVGVHENAVPYSTEPIAVAAPSKSVLEVPAGFVKRHGISIGDRAGIENVRSELLP